MRDVAGPAAGSAFGVALYVEMHELQRVLERLGR